MCKNTTDWGMFQSFGVPLLTQVTAQKTLALRNTLLMTRNCLPGGKQEAKATVSSNSFVLFYEGEEVTSISPRSFRPHWTTLPRQQTTRMGGEHFILPFPAWH